MGKNNKSLQKSSNQKLLLGLIIGSLLGFTFTYYGMDYLPITTNLIFSILIALFIFTVLIFLIIIWFKNDILKYIFKQDIDFDDIIESTEKVTSIITQKAVDAWLIAFPEETRHGIKALAPKLVNYILWGRFRNWALRFILTLLLALGGIAGTILLLQQNELLKAQNKKIDVQVYLEEASRRSSLIELFSNIMDKVDDELKDSTNVEQKLPKRLIGRIASLSQSFKPYRYLVGDSLKLSPLSSPERGQVLLSLANSNLHELSYQELYSSTTFERAYLENAIMWSPMLMNARIKHGFFANTVFRQGNLSFCTMNYSDLTNAEFLRCNMNQIVFEKANLTNVKFFDTNLKHAVFVEAEMKGVDFDESDLTDAIFGHNMDMYPKNLTIEQLSKAKTLKGAILPDSIKSIIQTRYPHLIK